MIEVPKLVLVAGAAGGTGLEIARILRQHKISARLLSSRAEAKAELTPLGEYLQGDLMKPAEAARAVQEVDAVLCAVGSRPNPIKMLLGGEMVDDVGTIHLIDAAKQAGVRRFVLVTSIGAGETADDIPGPLKLMLGKVLSAKERAESRLQGSGLDYTILRPGGLTNEAATGQVLGATRGLGGSIPRADVANVAVAALFQPHASGKTLSLVSEAGVRHRPPDAIRLDWQIPHA